MDAATRALVRARAGDRCEYCRLHEDDDPPFTFQIEHVVPKQHGGPDHPDNLALACPHCNRHKGTNLAGIDPFDGRPAFLFHPRQQRWEDHFAARGPLIIGQTPTGRATVRVLNMNLRRRVALRAAVASDDE